MTPSVSFAERRVINMKYNQIFYIQKYSFIIIDNNIDI